MKYILKITLRECYPHSKFSIPFYFFINFLFINNYLDVLAILLLKFFGFLNMSNFYLAKYYYYQGKFDLAKKRIEIFFTNSSKSFKLKEAIYLKSLIYYRLGMYLDSYEILSNLDTSYKKKWLYLSKIVSKCNGSFVNKGLFYIKNEDDFSTIKYKLNCLISLKLENEVIFLLRDLVKSKSDILLPTKKLLSANLAKSALFDLDSWLAKLGIEFFLVSGTFLACVRNRTFIPGDYDIDVGVMSVNDFNKIRILLQQGISFAIVDEDNEYCLKLLHRNGTKIDIFLHIQDVSGNVIHQGSCVKWVNSYFVLDYYIFYGRKFLGPKDYNKYLSENYANWTEPIKYYDNILDTPNSVVYNEKLFIIHLYKLLFVSYGKFYKDKIEKLIIKYNGLL